MISWDRFLFHFNYSIIHYSIVFLQKLQTTTVSTHNLRFQRTVYYFAKRPACQVNRNTYKHTKHMFTYPYVCMYVSLAAVCENIPCEWEAVWVTGSLTECPINNVCRRFFFCCFFNFSAVWRLWQYYYQISFIAFLFY